MSTKSGTCNTLVRTEEYLPFVKQILTLFLPSAGPASGFAVLSQAVELVNNGETIHQQLHMSEFDNSEKGALVDSGIRLPPKEDADKYIEGQCI